MKRTIITLTTLVLVALSLPVFAATTAPASTPELRQALGTTGKATLIFFQNPNGGPCKMQKQVLDQLTKDRKGNFAIVPVNANRPEDQQAFYDYGVRSLPSLILVDKAGKIAKVFPPGIQNQETLAAALNSLK